MKKSISFILIYLFKNLYITR